MRWGFCARQETIATNFYAKFLHFFYSQKTEFLFEWLLGIRRIAITGHNFIVLLVSVPRHLFIYFFLLADKLLFWLYIRGCRPVIENIRQNRDKENKKVFIFFCSQFLFFSNSSSIFCCCAAQEFDFPASSFVWGYFDLMKPMNNSWHGSDAEIVASLAIGERQQRCRIKSIWMCQSNSNFLFCFVSFPFPFSSWNDFCPFILFFFFATLFPTLSASGIDRMPSKTSPLLPASHRSILSIQIVGFLASSHQFHMTSCANEFE